MIRKAILIALTTAATTGYILNFADCSRTWYYRNEAGRVVTAISLKFQNGAADIVRRDAQEDNNPVWPKWIDLRPIYYQEAWMYNRLERLHHDSDLSFILVSLHCVSLAPLIILLAFYPTFAFIRGPVRRWRRRRHGLCIACSYNLTALTEPRCPECGEPFAPKRLADISNAQKPH